LGKRKKMKEERESHEPSGVLLLKKMLNSGELFFEENHSSLLYFSVSSI
jgi:hypothetical protein